MKLRVIIKRLSNPRIRRRLKIAVCIFFGGIFLGVMFKVVYDIGYFDSQALENDKIAEISTAQPVLTMELAQRIVTGALKEDPSSPTTIVTQIVDNNHRLATIIIENNKIKSIARIIDMRMLFTGPLFNDAGYNLNEGIEHQYNINRDNFNLGNR